MIPVLLSHFRVLLVPGLHDSPAGHWQSRWQRLYPAFERVGQDDWDDPHLPAWSDRVDQVRARAQRPTLIVAHSFGCLAAVHSVARNPGNVAGLLLVAPADPQKFALAPLLPQGPLPCPSIVVASSDDPWMSAPGAALWAERWGSRFVDAGAVGHINAASGLGDWPFGQDCLRALGAHMPLFCQRV